MEPRKTRPPDRRGPPVDNRPAPLVVRFADEIAHNAGDLVLDVGCGFGRNALYLANRGATVVGLDRDTAALRFISDQAPRMITSGALSLRQVDLELDEWRFAPNSVSAVVCVDFPPVFRVLRSLVASLRPGGYLLLQTIGGHGGNYLELPTPGAIRSVLIGDFEFGCFTERRVGPGGSAAATALIAVKHRRDDKAAI